MNSSVSTPSSSAFLGRSLKRQARGIVYHVFQYFSREKAAGNSKMNVREMTSEVTGVSSRTVGRVVREGKRSVEESGSASFVTPTKSKPHKKRIESDSFDDAVLRNKIREFYLNKKLPTVKTVLERKYMTDDNIIDENLDNFIINVGGGRPIAATGNPRTMKNFDISITIIFLYTSITFN